MSDNINWDVLIKIDEIMEHRDKGEHTSFVIMPYFEWLALLVEIKAFFDDGHELNFEDLNDSSYWSGSLDEFLDDLSVVFLTPEESLSFKKHFPSGKFGALRHLFNPENFAH